MIVEFCLSCFILKDLDIYYWDQLQGFCFPCLQSRIGPMQCFLCLHKRCFLILRASCEEHLLLLLCAVFPLCTLAVEKHSQLVSWCRGQIEFTYMAVMRLWGDAVWLQDHWAAAAAAGGDDDDDNCNEGSEWRWRQWHRWEDDLGCLQRLLNTNPILSFILSIFLNIRDCEFFRHST